uniref:Uncharacterized protein n=1 Tax=Oryza nivara TaxID=4536 RepID=A0A0E0HG90_ORYNI
MVIVGWVCKFGSEDSSSMLIKQVIHLIRDVLEPGKPASCRLIFQLPLLCIFNLYSYVLREFQLAGSSGHRFLEKRLHERGQHSFSDWHDLWIVYNLPGCELEQQMNPKGQDFKLRNFLAQPVTGKVAMAGATASDGRTRAAAAAHALPRPPRRASSTAGFHRRQTGDAGGGGGWRESERASAGSESATRPSFFIRQVLIPNVIKY